MKPLKGKPPQGNKLKVSWKKSHSVPKSVIFSVEKVLQSSIDIDLLYLDKNKLGNNLKFEKSK